MSATVQQSPIVVPRTATLERLKPYIGTLGVFLGAGVSTLNGRLITVGLPDLRGAMGLGVDDAAWIPTAYNMALMFMGPLTVYLGALLGSRRVLLPAAALFILCSILLPFSPNAGVTVGLQVVSGLASGTFYPLSLSYAIRSLPVRYLIYAVGVYSMDILGVINLAVPLAAWLTGHLSWHWIFWASVPPTLLMMLFIYLAVPHPPAPSGPRPAVSWEGFLYASLGLSLLYGAIDQGERLDWLNSGVVNGMLASGAFLLLAAVVRRWFGPNPLVKPQFLLKRNTLILGGALFSIRFVLLALALLIPAYLGAVRGYRPLETGRVLLWVALPQLLLGVLAAESMRRFDGRVIIGSGFSVVGLACLMTAQLTSAWAGEDFTVPLLVMAAGLSFAFVGTVGSFLQQAGESGATLQPVNILTYTAYIHLVRLLGGELGSVTMSRLVSVREQYHSNLIGLHVQAGGWLTDDRLRLLTAGLLPRSVGSEDAQGRAALVLAGQVKTQAFTLAYMDGFTACAMVAFAAVLLAVLMKPMKIYFDSTSSAPLG